MLLLEELGSRRSWSAFMWGPMSRRCGDQHGSIRPTALWNRATSPELVGRGDVHEPLRRSRRPRRQRTPVVEGCAAAATCPAGTTCAEAAVDSQKQGRREQEGDLQPLGDHEDSSIDFDIIDKNLDAERILHSCDRNNFTITRLHSLWVSS